METKMVKQAMTCETCDKENPAFSWTDTHGIGQCMTCGTPYRILFYDERHERIVKEPESIVAAEYKPILKRYWTEQRSTIPSGCSFAGGYERASPEEERCFYEWINMHFPKGGSHDGDGTDDH